MPLWKVYHPKDVFSPEDRQRIAEKITSLYAPMMPRFYVGVIFQELAPNTMFVGGVENPNFVRIWVDHIAREFEDDDMPKRFIRAVNHILGPFVADRGLDWEFHVDETPFRLWSIQGYAPPPAGSIDEKRWMAENRPSPRTHD